MDYDDDDLPSGYPNLWERMASLLRHWRVKPRGGTTALGVSRRLDPMDHEGVALKKERAREDSKKHYASKRSDPEWRAKKNQYYRTKYAMEKNVSATQKVLRDIETERRRQVDKWGIQHRRELDPLIEPVVRERTVRQAKAQCDYSEDAGKANPARIYPYTGGATWEEVLDEEIAEAYNEGYDKAARRKELVQCAAVLVAWIEDLDAH